MASSEAETATAARVVLALALIVCTGGCSRAAPAGPNTPQPSPPQSAQRTPANEQSGSKDSTYEPPTAEEMAPMRPEYLAELARIHEPPEMSGKPMQVRKPVSPMTIKAMTVMSNLGSPEKATHDQRSAAIRDLLEYAKNKEPDDGIDHATMYAVIATLACIDGTDSSTVIEYANKAIGDSGDMLALRARMYLKEGKRDEALDDLEKIMADEEGRALVGGDAEPRKDSTSCGWSVADLDALGADPRALAAKGLYLASFIPYNAEARGAVKESDIRDLYARSAASWHSPIPHFLAISLEGFGSEHSMNGARCIRPNNGRVPETVSACASYDEGLRRQIRELTMALVIEPTFAPARSARASKYLELAQAAYLDRKPSRRLFELAIDDYTEAIAAGGRDKHTLYCDRSMALASVGKYQDAALGYVEGMKYAKNGIEESPFVYEQLAGVYTKIGRFNEAAEILTQAIMNASGGGMDAVIFFGGIAAFRKLYPEYDLLPDEILADIVRRRYEPQFPQSWDASFVSGQGAAKGKGGVASSILPDLYVTRGDAYMKAGRRADALSDYRRVKSDAWSGEERFLPRHMYFDESGHRNHDSPEPWPAPPPAL
jgi:tetratricopeptide (TPR) repeat protein